MTKTVILFEMSADRTSEGKKRKPCNKKIVKNIEPKNKLLGLYYNQKEL